MQGTPDQPSSTEMLNLFGSLIQEGFISPMHHSQNAMRAAKFLRTFSNQDRNEILCLIATSSGITAAEICAKSGLSPSKVYQHLKRLAQQGWVDSLTSGRTKLLILRNTQAQLLFRMVLELARRHQIAIPSQGQKHLLPKHRVSRAAQPQGGAGAESIDHLQQMLVELQRAAASQAFLVSVS